MRKGRRSAERLFYWPEVGSRALTRREQEMPRSFAENNKCFSMAAEVVISLVLALLMALKCGTQTRGGGSVTTATWWAVSRAAVLRSRGTREHKITF
jgi:hypothetical protein